MLEGIVDLIRVKLIALTNTLAQEVITALLGEDRDLVRWDGIYMVGESKFSLNNCLPLLAHVDSLMELVRIFIEEEERKASNQLFLACAEYSDLVLLFLEVVVEDLDWSPDIFLVLIDWGQGVSLVGARLAKVYPLLNRLVFFPSIVSCQGFNAGQVGATVEYLILLFENLQSLLSGFVLVGGCLDLFEEGLLTDDIFVLFNNICMSCRQTLTF